MSFGPIQRYIDGHLVQPGLVLEQQLSSTPFWGRRLKAAARCESVNPDSWTSLLLADGVEVWRDAVSHSSNAAATSAAKEHFGESVEQGLRELLA